MTIIMPNCTFCGGPAVPHCHEAKMCEWLRCAKCHAYGKLESAWRQYDKGAAFNLMTMNDVITIAPQQLPATRQAIAGYSD